MAWTTDSADVNDFLECTDVVDWTDPSVAATAARIVDGSTADVERCQRLFEWVRDQIPHSKDIESELVSCEASDVLKKGTGICYAKSHLLAALCRASGVPTGFCYQVYQTEPGRPRTALHGFTAHFLASQGRWVRLDARGNTGYINAQFSLTEELLAFPVNPALGELYIYETIFHRPAPQVVQTLRAFSSRKAMWDHLPEVIPSSALRTTEDQAFNASLLSLSALSLSLS